MTPAPWKQWEGQVVDLCFPLRRYLGGSDRSAVYLTQIGDPEPRNAAVKLIPAGAEEADAAIQWDRAAQLSHPNLLRLLRTGRSQVNQAPVRYAVTEYAEENLADVLAERPLTAEEARDMLKTLLAALAYLHGEGLVHGRVKPANIMAVNDELKLSVDGITLVGEPGMTTNAPGRYDPPEIRDRGCSPVGDVWSFGVTVVECLTQKVPVVNGPKQDPVLPESIPAEFLPMVRACLRADPRRRATIDEILGLLERPESVAAPEVVERPARAPRKWVNFVLVGASAVVLAGVFAGPRLLRHPVANADADRSVAAPPPTTAPAPAAPPVEPPAESPQPAKPAPFVPAREEILVAKPPAEPATAPVETKRAIESPSAEVTHQVLPQVTDAARKTIHGKVRIQVRATVDVDGRVADAKVVSQNSRYFGKLALDAARQWEFSAGPGEWILRFEFTTADTTVKPSRVGK
jgi:TonB family protein